MPAGVSLELPDLALLWPELALPEPAQPEPAQPEPEQALALAGPLAAELLLLDQVLAEPPAELLQAEQPGQPEQPDAHEDIPMLPVRRFPRRGSALAAHMRYCKLRISMSRGRCLVRSMYQRLANAWDDVHGLRQGERAADLGALSRRRHKNKWSFVHSIKLAYKSVGARASSGKPGELGATRRGCETLAAHSSLAVLAQTRGYRQALCQQPPEVIVIDRSLDATPLLVSFGQLEGAVAGHARYLVPPKEPGQRWTLVTLEELQRIRPRSRPKFGVLDVVAQDCQIRWAHASGRRADNLFVPPCFVASTGSSNLWAAHELALPELDRANVAGLCTTAKWVLFNMTPDSCPANLRMVNHLADGMPPNAFLNVLPCVAHTCHLILTGGASIAEDRVIGDVHALEYVARIPSHYNTLLATLSRFVHDHLQILDDGRRPCPEDADRLGRLLALTVRRRIDHVRGRLLVCDDPDSAFAPGRRAEDMDSICERLQLIFNGDIRLPHPVHIKTEATQHMSRGELVHAAVDAFVRAGLLPGGSATVPSKNRWGSMAASLEGQVGGFLLHDLLGAAVSRTFVSFEDGDPLTEEADVRQVTRRKAWRAKQYAREPRRRRAACLSLLVNLPVDHVWRHVQHREEHGAALQDLCCHNLNFFTQAGRSYYKMVAAPVSEGLLSPFFWHFGPDGHTDHAGLLHEVRGAALQKAAHLWSVWTFRWRTSRTNSAVSSTSACHPRTSRTSWQSSFKLLCAAWTAASVARSVHCSGVPRNLAVARRSGP